LLRKEVTMYGQEALEVWSWSPKLIEENEYEGHCKCMQNFHGLIVLIESFQTVGGMPCGSSQLRRYALFKMIV
jgi:hypothetical protein